MGSCEEIDIRREYKILSELRPVCTYPTMLVSPYGLTVGDFGAHFATMGKTSQERKQSRGKQ